MLVQFTVENFLSFGEPATLSMRATCREHHHPGHLVDGIRGVQGQLLRTAAIYGANAAGKSNLVKAMRFARNLILQGTSLDKPISITPFRLGNAGKPSRFEFMLYHGDVLYSYGFVVDSAQVVEEWLYATHTTKEVRYFERTTAEGQVSVEFGASFTGRSAKQKQFLNFVAQGTRPNQLFLTEAASKNVQEVLPVMEWFGDVLLIIEAEAKYKLLEVRVQKDTQFTDYLASFLRSAGTGIDSVIASEVDLDFGRYFPDMPEEVSVEILGELKDTENTEGVMILPADGERYFAKIGQSGIPTLLRLRTQHRASDGGLVEFGVNEESDGTQRLMHLVPALLSLQQRQPKVIILDELDRRLHPLLTKFFLESALKCQELGGHNQLMFTTHDTNLLSLDLLRRDEIWFVEKDGNGCSWLYSLSEFKIRPDLQIEKGYLAGRFGAVPFVGNICELGWLSHVSEVAKNT